MKNAGHTPTLPRPTKATAICLDRQDILQRTLQLIGARSADQHEAHQAIAHENRASARNGPLPTDARLNVISETVRRLQGTLLTPEDRRAVVQLGNQLGMRSFDANMLMAIVQDRARRGEPLTMELPRQMHPDHAKHGHAGRNGTFWRFGAAILAGVTLAAIASSWLLNV